MMKDSIGIPTLLISRVCTADVRFPPRRYATIKLTMLRRPAAYVDHVHDGAHCTFPARKARADSWRWCQSARSWCSLLVDPAATPCEIISSTSGPLNVPHSAYA